VTTVSIRAVLLPALRQRFPDKPFVEGASGYGTKPFGPSGQRKAHKFHHVNEGLAPFGRSVLA